MTMTFSDTLGVAGLYLALLSLLSTFFFIHLGDWLAAIYGLKAKVDFLVSKPRGQHSSEKLESYYSSSAQSSRWIFIGWIIVTAFMFIIGAFLEALRRNLPPDQAPSIWSFIFLPGILFLVIYLGASIPMLFFGYSVARDNTKRLKDTI